METEPKKESVQERFGKSAEAGIEAAKQMTNSQVLAQARLNSGYRAIRIQELPKPAQGKSKKA